MDIQTAQDRTGEIRRRYYEARDRVANDPRRSAEAKKDDIGRLVAIANADIAKIHEDYKGAQALRLNRLKAQLFATTDAPSYRDACDRAKATSTRDAGYELRALLEDANRSGDKELQRGVLAIAIDRGDSETMTACAAGRDDIANAITEYRHLAGGADVEQLTAEAFAFSPVTA